MDIKKVFIGYLFGLLVFGVSSIMAQTSSVGELVATINATPSVYGTPEAISYFATKPNNGGFTFSTNREDALNGLRAAITLGDMETEASGACASLVQVFPRIVHVSVLRGVVYGPKMGGFDDWVQTYVLTETNKVLLTAVLIEYTTMQKCEDFITSTQEVKISQKKMGAAGKILEATADIYITITISPGACALTKITGQTFGDNKDAWLSWWAQYGSEYTATEPVEPIKQAKSSFEGLSFDLSTLLVGGKYKLVLKTGDVFTGTIESIQDNGIIFESDDKKPYTFAKDLISEQQLIDVPEKLKAKPRKGTGIVESEILSFDELARTTPKDLLIEVTMANMSLLRGILDTINNDILTLNIEGSKVPISKNAIAKIEKAPNPKNETLEIAKKIPQGPFDTLIIQNPQTDEFGKALPDLLVIGTISSDNGKAVLMTLSDGSAKSVSYASIVRRIDHEQNAGLSEIERYGKPLFCPAGMKLVDVPPSKPGKPYFKVCVDMYEWPNQKSVVPKVGISFDEAKKNCEAIGKRLCTSYEWQAACGGLEDYAYPYGNSFTEENCNGNSRIAEPSGNRVKCYGKIGTYDMTGNVFEWVSADAGPTLMGGPLSKCQTLAPGTGGSAKPSSGGRCCKSN